MDTQMDTCSPVLEHQSTHRSLVAPYGPAQGTKLLRSAPAAKPSDPSSPELSSTDIRKNQPVPGSGSLKTVTSWSERSSGSKVPSEQAPKTVN